MIKFMINGYDWYWFVDLVMILLASHSMYLKFIEEYARERIEGLICGASIILPFAWISAEIIAFTLFLEHFNLLVFFVILSIIFSAMFSVALAIAKAREYYF